VQALAGAAGVAIDNARQYEQARRRQRWLEATSQVITALLAGGDTTGALHLIAAHAQELTAADYSLIALPLDPGPDPGETTELSVQVCVGAGAETLTGRAIPVRGSTTGAVFTDHTARSVSRLAFDVAAGLGIDFGPALALPLGVDGPLAGVLLAVRGPGSPTFTDDDLQLVSSFADQAVLALHFAQTQAARRELEILADRDRIARDLHDSAIQRLSTIGFGLNGVLGRIRDPDLARRVSAQITSLDQVIRDISTVVDDLQADARPPRSLRARLNRIIDELTGESGPRTLVRLSGPLDRVPAELARHVEVALREGITAALAGVSVHEIVITVGVDDNVAITITDDGLPDPASRDGRDGLTRRAAAAGGSCRITRPEGGGTRLAWVAPLAR
jgi:signal transduction histidine kinase